MLTFSIRNGVPPVTEDKTFSLRFSEIFILSLYKFLGVLLFVNYFFLKQRIIGENKQCETNEKTLPRISNFNSGFKAYEYGY